MARPPSSKLQTYLLNPLRPLLVPLIRSLPQSVHSLSSSLLGPKCHSSLVLNLDATSNPSCLPLAVSKALGIAIVSLSAVIKVPQIAKLISSCTAHGVSFSACAIETVSLLITLAYNARQGFPFGTYGECAMIAIQDIIIGFLVLTLTNRHTTAVGFSFSIALMLYVFLFSGESLLSIQTMGYLQAASGGLSIISKIPQIMTIWARGDTGQLSAFAVFNYLFGSIARIFTTLQEVDDMLILFGFLSNFAFNAILAAQMVYYWGVSDTSELEKEKKDSAYPFEYSARYRQPRKFSGFSTDKQHVPITRRRG